jgi:hypothetical protein
VSSGAWLTIRYARMQARLLGIGTVLPAGTDYTISNVIYMIRDKKVAKKSLCPLSMNTHSIDSQLFEKIGSKYFRVRGYSE